MGCFGLLQSYASLRPGDTIGHAKDTQQLAQDLSVGLQNVASRFSGPTFWLPANRLRPRGSLVWGT